MRLITYLPVRCSRTRGRGTPRCSIARPGDCSGASTRRSRVSRIRPRSAATSLWDPERALEVIARDRAGKIADPGAARPRRPLRAAPCEKTVAPRASAASPQRHPQRRQRLQHSRRAADGAAGGPGDRRASRLRRHGRDLDRLRARRGDRVRRFSEGRSARGRLPRLCRPDTTRRVRSRTPSSPPCGRLAAMRLCTSVSLSAQRRTAEPENAYLLVSEAPAWDALAECGRSIRGSRTTACAPRADGCPVRRLRRSRRGSGARRARWVRRGRRRGPGTRGRLRPLGREPGVPSPARGALDGRAMTARLFERWRAAGEELGVGRYDEARLLYAQRRLRGIPAASIPSGGRSTSRSTSSGRRARP